MYINKVFVNKLAGGLIILILLGLFGCDEPKNLTSYDQAILQSRFDKDNWLRDESRTILRPAEFAFFSGLNYFPVDSTFRFLVTILPVTETTIAVPQFSGTETDDYLRVGKLVIPFTEGEQTLFLYKKANSAKPVYWLPFTDLTSGKSTYGGGRYLNVGEPNQNNQLILDFNMAYNPYCDYNPEYICAIPPAENRLNNSVLAGEKASNLLTY